MSTYKDLPVAEVKISVDLTFGAYVQIPDGGVTMNERVLAEAIAHAVADAVEFRAPYGAESDEGDTLIALVNGGSSDAVTVRRITLDLIDDAPDERLVKEAAESTSDMT